MRFIIQRVSEASVTVEDQTIGKIQKGFLVLIGVSDSDTQETADKLIKKMIGLRIFEDENGKTNLSLADVNGSLLLVSQFTLYANCKKGNQALSKQVLLIKPMPSMNISSQNAACLFPAWKPANLVQI